LLLMLLLLLLLLYLLPVLVLLLQELLLALALVLVVLLVFRVVVVDVGVVVVVLVSVVVCFSLSSLLVLVHYSFSSPFQLFFSQSFCFCLGSLTGNVVSLPTLLGTDRLWTVTMSLAAVLASPVFLILPAYIHDSPRYLVLCRDKRVEGVASITFYQGTGTGKKRVRVRVRVPVGFRTPDYQEIAYEHYSFTAKK